VSEQLPTAVSNPLVEFCRECITRYANKWPATESDLAMDFVFKFDVLPLLTTGQIETLCFQLGIKVSFRALAPELAGHNCSYENDNLIELNEQEIVFGGMTHTLFHEIREIVERYFIDLRYPVMDENERELRADLFAGAVRTYCIHEIMGYLADGIADISSDLIRWGAYALLFAGVFAHGAACVLLPQQEDYVSKRR
jgi:hypothetical protein